MISEKACILNAYLHRTGEYQTARRSVFFCMAKGIQCEEEFVMEKCNECIKCTVEQCRHHHDTKNYCTLDSIQVGTHEMNPTQDQCTDCMSFAVK